MREEDIAEKIRYILEPLGELSCSFYDIKVSKESGQEKIEFDNKYVELLLQLESKIDTDAGKDFFWRLMGSPFLPLGRKIEPKSILSSAPRRMAYLFITKHSDVAAMVYLKSQRIDDVLDGLIQQKGGYGSLNEWNEKVISCISKVLIYERYLFSADALKKIETVVQRFRECIRSAHLIQAKLMTEVSGKNAERTLPEFVRKTLSGSLKVPPTETINRFDGILDDLERVMAGIRFERTKDELKGVSLQINQDKKELIRRYDHIGLDKNLVVALERIDIETEETGSKFKFSKSIGFLRNVYEESLRQFAIKIRDRLGIPIPQWTDKGKMGEAIDYFRKIRLISESEYRLLTGFSSQLSDTGSHRLTSEKFEVRLAKNILIEICLYLADKIENFLRDRVRAKP